jgi:hypothetical protein
MVLVNTLKPLQRKNASPDCMVRQIEKIASILEQQAQRGGKPERISDPIPKIKEEVNPYPINRRQISVHEALTRYEEWEDLGLDLQQLSEADEEAQRARTDNPAKRYQETMVDLPPEEMEVREPPETTGKALLNYVQWLAKECGKYEDALQSQREGDRKNTVGKFRKRRAQGTFEYLSWLDDCTKGDHLNPEGYISSEDAGAAAEIIGVYASLLTVTEKQLLGNSLTQRMAQSRAAAISAATLHILEHPEQEDAFWHGINFVLPNNATYKDEFRIVETGIKAEVLTAQIALESPLLAEKGYAVRVTRADEDVRCGMDLCVLDKETGQDMLYISVKARKNAEPRVVGVTIDRDGEKGDNYTFFNTPSGNTENPLAHGIDTKLLGHVAQTETPAVGVVMPSEQAYNAQTKESTREALKRAFEMVAGHYL